MSTPPALPRCAARGWFSNRSLGVKFGVLVGTVVVSLGAVVGSVLVGNSVKKDASAELANLNQAEALVLQLDTRASELKVDGFKAIVRPDPTEQLSELADDIATPEAMLAELDTIPLTGESAEAVAGLEESYGGYTDAITAFINAAIADQAGTRVLWEDIQTANDLTDGAVGAAKDALAPRARRRRSRWTPRSPGPQLISVLVALGALLLIVGVSLVTMRSITRPGRPR